MQDIFYNTHILKSEDDVIIAGSVGGYLRTNLDYRKGVTVEMFLSAVEENIRKSVMRHYNSAYEKALSDNPSGGIVDAERVAMDNLNDTIKTYLPDAMRMEDVLSISDIVYAIFNGNGFSSWKNEMRTRFKPFTDTAIPTKVSMSDISGGDINISEEEAAQELEEITLIDILESLSTISNER